MVACAYRTVKDKLVTAIFIDILDQWGLKRSITLLKGSSQRMALTDGFKGYRMEGNFGGS